MNNIIETVVGAKVKGEPVAIQELWSGYGTIKRYFLDDLKVESVIVKHIEIPDDFNHPRGWNTNHSHKRKLKSYQVEAEWYNNYAWRCSKNCVVPFCYETVNKQAKQVIILEDLDSTGYPIRKSQLTIIEAKLVLKWLANFHATFMNETAEGLWEQGTYWHLETRPEELDAMENGWLKENAFKIDLLLKNCKFKTIVHGDAKVANFCFSESMQAVAAVDFQYVGGGCGMKDVAYFLGSCLTENQCENFEKELLDYYFYSLESILVKLNKFIDISLLKVEWVLMYDLAWADFVRFLQGWSPSHKKLNFYSEKMVQRSKISLNQLL